MTLYLNFWGETYLRAVQYLKRGWWTELRYRIHAQ
jgi:hypothetical protein